MGDQDNKVFEKTKIEYIQFINEFKTPSLENNNYLAFYPERKYVNEVEKSKEIKEESSFYDKYKEMNLKSEGVFYLEDELVKQIKNWLSIKGDYNLSNKRDEFYNEEYVKEILFEGKFIHSSYSIINFELIFYIIGQLEKKMFDYVLLQQWTYKDEKNLPPLKAPLFKTGFIELLIKNDIEEKLNNLYQDKSLGYTYIAEKLITLDLFIIFVILKNFPFFVLTRQRLENLFDLLKKYKSWPYPIGSVGMDIFKLLINELYLPGVTLVNELREAYFLDIIDPKTKEIYIKDFNKVISFDKDIFYSSDGQLEGKEGNQEKGKKILSSYPNFTFTFLGVYVSYILYANEEKKESDREEQYLENILSLFEKKFKQNKETNGTGQQQNNNNNNNDFLKENTNDISEKNIINNFCNLIDNGLNSNFENFTKEVKILNDKLILKAKETHDTKGSKPRDLINIRKFLEPKLKYIEFKKEFLNNEDLDENYNSGITNNVIKINIQTNNLKSSKDGGNDDIEEKDDLIDKQNKMKIAAYRNQLKKAQEVQSDEILTDYVQSFIELKKKYFSHLKPFKIEDYKFSIEKEKQEVLNFNKTVRIKEKFLAEKYKQKYIITEDNLPYFIQNLKFWKSKVNAVYHAALYKEKEKIFEKIKEKKENSTTFNEREKEKEQNEIECKELENIVTQKLDLNYQLYLIPERRTNTSSISNRVLKSLSKYISKQDYLYKVIIGDFYLSYKVTEPTDKQISEIPLKLYLNEAKHNFNLKVFNSKVTYSAGTEIKAMYGSLHIEAIDSLVMELIDLEEVYNFSTDKKQKIFIDIINLYDENKESDSKINNIEKYLVSSTDDYFQIFVSAIKENTDSKVKDSKNEDYFKRFVVNLLDFDSQTLNYQAKHIKLSSNAGFKITFNYTEQVIEDVREYEINFKDRNEVNISTFIDIN